LGKKLVGRINISIELELLLIGCGAAELVTKYSQLELQIFLDYSDLE